jgi:hypothetical protein
MYVRGPVANFYPRRQLVKWDQRGPKAPRTQDTKSRPWTGNYGRRGLMRGLDKNRNWASMMHVEETK